MQPVPRVPTPQPSDPTGLPSKRRVIWEHGQDMALMNKGLLFALALCAGALALCAGVLLSIYTRPPVVLAQDEGYLMYRTTKKFRLDPDMLRAYCRVVLGGLYTITPGYTELSDLAGKVDGKIIEHFTKAVPEDLITASNQRRVYTLRDIRRYTDPKLPQYFTLAVRGERALYEYNPAAASPFRMSSENVVNVLYLQEITPSPQNPWGLLMVGITIKRDAEASAVWETATPLDATQPRTPTERHPPR